MEREIARIVIHRCLGYKRGEHLLIICDDKLEMLAHIFYRVAKQEGIECLFLKMSPRKMHGQEPPKEVAAALKETDIALLLTSMSLSHTPARKQASARYGVRIASLPGITPQIFRRAIRIDYSALKRKVDAVAKRLSKGKRMEVYTDKGTHLEMSIEGRAGFSDDGLYIKQGAFGNLPAGEACIAPVEGTTDGVLVVDGSAPFAGKVKRPVKIFIKKGRIQNMPLGQISSLIKSLGSCAQKVAEFGIGLNPYARVSGNILEDEKATGTAHLAIGANISFGGKVYCPCHLDFVFFNPVIIIDGRIIKIK